GPNWFNLGPPKFLSAEPPRDAFIGRVPAGSHPLRPPAPGLDGPALPLARAGKGAESSGRRPVLAHRIGSPRCPRSHAIAAKWHWGGDHRTARMNRARTDRSPFPNNGGLPCGSAGLVEG